MNETMKTGPMFPAREQTDIEIRLSIALDLAHAGSWETDLVTGKNYWDERIPVMLGLSGEEAADRQDQWLDFVHPDDRSRVAAAFEASCKTGGPPFSIEFRGVRADGRECWFFSRGSLVIEGEKPVRMVGMIQDITQKKLQVSSERLRLAQEAARVGTFDWDIEAGVNTWTPELESLYGLPCGTFPGTQAAWEQLIHPEDRDAALQRVAESLKTGKPASGEWRVIWPDNSVHWLYGRWQMIRNPGSDTPARVIGVNMDITEQKVLGQELRRTTDLLSNVYTSLEEAVLVVSPETRRIISVNPSAEKIFGYKQTEMVGRDTQFLHVNKKAYQAFGRLLFSALDEKGVFHTEFKLKRKSGEVFSSEHTVKEIRNEAGQMELLVSVVRDISGREKVMDQLRAKGKELTEQARQLKEMNITLKVLLDRREKEKIRQIEAFTQNISSAVLPHLEKIKKKQSSAACRKSICLF